ncbi:MarR family transcriptional regulator [Cryobacterium frigoriphilum]|uniref:MarR family transcriptional regulator n=1 Tax=Cryobacterium frigoriphilum TaxID=1259150 RepID=A0A4R8ZUW7_9MICO|nr:MarR family transcriptional regulator [Cryobacterium frigoriphilum]
MAFRWGDSGGRVEKIQSTELLPVQPILRNIYGRGREKERATTARVQDISAEMSITVGATSKLVGRLEWAGLAVRSAHPRDRRSSVVSLSDRGLTSLMAVAEVAEAHLRVLGDILPADRADLLCGQLSALRAHSRAAVRARSRRCVPSLSTGRVSAR